MTGALQIFSEIWLDAGDCKEVAIVSCVIWLESIVCYCVSSEKTAI